MASVGIGRQHKAWRFFVIIFASQFACLSRNRFPISTSALPGRHLACLLSVSNDILDLCLESRVGRQENHSWNYQIPSSEKQCLDSCKVLLFIPNDSYRNAQQARSIRRSSFTLKSLKYLLIRSVICVLIKCHNITESASNQPLLSGRLCFLVESLQNFK